MDQPNTGQIVHVREWRHWERRYTHHPVCSIREPGDNCRSKRTCSVYSGAGIVSGPARRGNQRYSEDGICVETPVQYTDKESKPDSDLRVCSKRKTLSVAKSAVLYRRELTGAKGVTRCFSTANMRTARHRNDVTNISMNTP